MYWRVIRKNTCHRFNVLSRCTNTVSTRFELIFKTWPIKKADPTLQSQREINFIIYVALIGRNELTQNGPFSILYFSSQLKQRGKRFFPKRFLLSVNDAAQMQFVFPGCNQFAKAGTPVKGSRSCQAH